MQVYFHHPLLWGSHGHSHGTRGGHHVSWGQDVGSVPAALACQQSAGLAAGKRWASGAGREGMSLWSVPHAPSEAQSSTKQAHPRGDTLLALESGGGPLPSASSTSECPPRPHSGHRLPKCLVGDHACQRTDHLGSKGDMQTWDLRCLRETQSIWRKQRNSPGQRSHGRRCDGTLPSHPGPPGKEGKEDMLDRRVLRKTPGVGTRKALSPGAPAASSCARVLSPLTRTFSEQW